MLAVVDVGGVGYSVHVPLSTQDALEGQDEVSLFTHLVVREDDLRLYGFATKSERALFVLLLSVSGVGPSIALAALSALGVEEFSSALAHGELKTLQRIKGVGKRVAERLVVELKDRVSAAGPALAGEAGGRADRLVEDAAAALVQLGYSAKDARGRVEAAAEAGGSTVQDLIREALRSS